MALLVITNKTKLTLPNAILQNQHSYRNPAWDPLILALLESHLFPAPNLGTKIWRKKIGTANVDFCLKMSEFELCPKKNFHIETLLTFLEENNQFL